MYCPTVAQRILAMSALDCTRGNPRLIFSRISEGRPEFSRFLAVVEAAPGRSFWSLSLGNVAAFQFEVLVGTRFAKWRVRPDILVAQHTFQYLDFKRTGRVSDRQ